MSPLEWTTNHQEHDGVAHREDNVCYCKLITNLADNVWVIGLHYVGPDAGDVGQGYAVAMKCGANVTALPPLVGCPPSPNPPPLDQPESHNSRRGCGGNPASPGRTGTAARRGFPGGATTPAAMAMAGGSAGGTVLLELAAAAGPGGAPRAGAERLLGHLRAAGVRVVALLPEPGAVLPAWLGACDTVAAATDQPTAAVAVRPLAGRGVGRRKRN